MSKEKEEGLQAEGIVTQSFRGGFLVQLNDSGHIVTAHLAGKLRKNFIRVVEGDKVTVEDRKSTRLNSVTLESRMPSSA